MNECYRQGFIDKCAELGVDPEHLCKVAARGDRLMKYLAHMSPPDSVHASLKKHINLHPETLASKGEAGAFRRKHKAIATVGEHMSRLPDTSDNTGVFKNMHAQARYNRAYNERTGIQDKINKRLDQGEKK